jgi:hypothetical protein
MPQGPATLDVTTTVESWFADPASNHGWCFTQWDDPNRGQFVACEDEVHPEQRPSLSITYELIPATSDGGTP